MTIKDKLGNFNSICWYPSAGMDFRPMLFLSPAWAKLNGWDEDKFPDCFLFTGGDGYCVKAFLEKEKGVLYKDERTSVVATKTEELEPLALRGKKALTFDAKELFRPGEAPDKDEYFGRVFFMEVHIASKTLGEWDTHLVYAVCENVAFALEYAFPEELRFDYIYRAHYGYRWPQDGVGTRSNGLFVMKLLRKFKTRYVVSDDDFEERFTDKAVDALYPEVLKNRPQAALQRVLHIDEDVRLAYENNRRPDRYYEYGLSVWKVSMADKKIIPLHDNMHFRMCVTVTPFMHLVEKKFKNMAECAEGIKELAMQRHVRIPEPPTGDLREFLNYLGEIQEKGIIVVPDWEHEGCRKPLV